MVRIVTISGEYGSGSSAIAGKIAVHLGWKLWDKDLTLRIASLVGCHPMDVERREERTDPLYYRLFKSFLRGSFDTQQLGRVEFLDAERLATLTERVVREASASGNAVIVGRGSPHFLRDLQDAFHVFVHAPYEDKVRRLRETGIGEDEATDLIETTDRRRAEFIKKYFGLEWPDRYLYHLLINSKIGDEAVVKTILGAIHVIDEQRPAAP